MSKKRWINNIFKIIVVVCMFWPGVHTYEQTFNICNILNAVVRLCRILLSVPDLNLYL